MTNYSLLQSPSKMGGNPAVDPGVTYDSAAGFQVGDMLVNTATGVLWTCISNAAGAAVWAPVSRGGRGVLLARLIGANMNVTTDQAFTMFVPTGLSYRVTNVASNNASTSLTTCHGGIYTAVSKGGTAIVADGATNFAGQTTAAAVIDLTVVTAQLALMQTAQQLYLSLTAAQGGAATSDLRIYGDVAV